MNFVVCISTCLQNIYNLTYIRNDCEVITEQACSSDFGRMSQTKWDMSVLRKFNSTSHNRIISILKNELNKHPLPRADKKNNTTNKD